MDPITLQEIYRQSFKVQKNTEATAFWQNNTLAFRIDKDIFMLEVANSMHLDVTGIDISTTAITCPSTSIATKFLQGYKNQIIPLSELITLNVDPALLAHNTELLKDVAMFTACEWSQHPLYSNKHILATLTNFGNVEFFGQQGKFWVSILNLSEAMEALIQYKMEPDDYNISAALPLITTAICWINIPTKKSYFATAQRNRVIIFWSINLTGDNLEAMVIGQTNIDSSVANIYCVAVTESKFLLIYTTSTGQLYSLDCDIENETVFIKNATCLWKDKDRMVVQHLKYKYIENKLILLFAKHRHLVSLSYNEEDPEKSAQSFVNVDDSRITCLTQNEDYFIITTENFKLHKVLLKLQDKGVLIETSEIKVNQYANSNLYNVSLSCHGVIWALCTLEHQVESRANPISINLILFEATKDVTNIVLENPERNMTRVWDCLEIIRHNVMKHKRFPNIDYTQLYDQGCKDLYKLKFFLFLLNLVNKIKVLKSCSFGPAVPDVSEEAVKELILFKHAQDSLNKILTSYENNRKQLTELQRDSLVFIKDYFDYYSKKYNCAKVVNEDVFTIVPPGKYECQCCDVEYSGRWYGSKHMNMMCSVTLSQINSDDYLYCPKCNVTARLELFNEMPTCIFCDVILIKN